MIGKTFSIETSKGMVELKVTGKQVWPESVYPASYDAIYGTLRNIYYCEILSGRQNLADMYRFCDVEYNMDNGWARVNLDDGYDGSPEYKAIFK